jgi:spore germination cell wall hydrolase CwlJ-like protein
MYKVLLTVILLCVCTSVNSEYQTVPKIPVILKEKVGVKPYSKVVDPIQLKCLTDNIYFEARNERDIGKKAVALVTLNRIKKSEYPDTICGVVYHRLIKYHCQFSWTCIKNPRIRYPWLYKQCKKIAESTLINYGYEHDFTHGATHFRRYGAKQPWEKRIKVTFSTRAHIFYKL